jgi:hypothetical protein
MSWSLHRSTATPLDPGGRTRSLLATAHGTRALLCVQIKRAADEAMWPVGSVLTSRRRSTDSGEWRGGADSCEVRAQCNEVGMVVNDATF